MSRELEALLESGRCGETYPEHVGILQVGLRITLLGVDEVREFGGISDEEDGGVVEDLSECTNISNEKNHSLRKSNNIGLTQSQLPSSVLVARPDRLRTCSSDAQYKGRTHRSLRANPLIQKASAYVTVRQNSKKSTPLGSRAVSAEPDSPPTVENLAVVLALLPTLLKRAAEVMSEMSWVTSKYPWAPAPLA